MSSDVTLSELLTDFLEVVRTAGETETVALFQPEMVTTAEWDRAYSIAWQSQNLNDERGRSREHVQHVIVLTMWQQITRQDEAAESLRESFDREWVIIKALSQHQTTHNARYRRTRRSVTNGEFMRVDIEFHTDAYHPLRG